MGLISGILGNAGVVSAEKLMGEYAKLLAEGEEIEVGFKVIRDVFIFTNLRMLLVNKQGITGKKVEYLSIRYKSISRFSIETAGHLDFGLIAKIYRRLKRNLIARSISMIYRKFWQTTY